MKILCMSDLHLSSVRPMCRTDEDWVATQQEHLDYVLNYVKDKQIHYMVIAGDIFDTHTVPPVIINMMLQFILNIRALGCEVYIIAGNHDLPYKNTERMFNSSFGALSLLPSYNECFFDCYHYGEDHGSDTDRAVILHHFAVQDEQHRPPMRECVTADELFTSYPNSRLIIVGDNHESWYVKNKNRYIINCGTFIQRTAAEAKRPCGFWIVDSSEIAPTYVDLSFLSEGKIDTSYLEDIKEREENRGQYEALLSELRDGVENKYDFVALLNEYVESHKKDMDEGTYNILMETLNYIRSK